MALVKPVRQFPIMGCWAQEDWEETGLVVVTVLRRQPNGRLVVGNYLVDTYCLGVKDTFVQMNVEERQFQDFLLQMYRQVGRPVEISPELAHEIIYGAIEYARQFGFRPHRDFTVTQYVLDPPEMHPQRGQVTFGHEGKPLYVAGPHDNPLAIMAQLERTAGAGNYHFVLNVDGMPFDLLPIDQEMELLPDEENEDWEEIEDG